MSFTPKYVTIRVSGIGKVTKVSIVKKDGQFSVKDVVAAATEAFEAFGGLAPLKIALKPIKGRVTSPKALDKAKTAEK